MLRIGLISDTHGLLPPEALDRLHGAHPIVHAGDIGGDHVLQRLEVLAPLSAVRGDNDHGSWAEALPETAGPTLGGVTLHVLHDLQALGLAAVPARSVAGCWCSAERIPAATLDRASPALRGRACVCAGCAGGSKGLDG